MTNLFTGANLTRLMACTLFSLCLCSPTHVEAQSYARKTNLPAIYIATENNKAITSKENYIYSTLWYVDDQDVTTQYDSVSIRGRGNSTWNMPKKPYRIKFLSKEKFLGKGYAKAKKWTLLANAADKTMIRNAVTSYMGEYIGLDFNPAYKFVDLTLNGTYQGTYQISDQVEVRAHRVNIEEQDYPLADTSDISGGFLLEVDGFKDGNCFTTSKCSVPIRIHYPDEDEIATSQNNYIKNYIADFETALFSSDFADAEKGYRPMVDSVSLVDWYIATEVSANIDGFYSTYFYKRRQDPKLYWGPLWDYDIAYGNDTRKGDTSKQMMTDVGYGQTRTWVNQMWNDPWFAKKVNARYKELVDGGLEEAMLECVDSLTELLGRSQELNYNKWGIRTRVYNERVLYSSYDQYVSDLKTFISTHIPYLTTAFGSKEPAEPTPAFTTSDHYYRIINVNTGNALDILNSSANAGAFICAWANTEDRLSEEWVIKATGDYFHITNRNGGMALNDPTEGSVGETVNIGTQLNTAQSDTLDDRQLWTIQPQGTNGYYNLINKYTRHTANLSGGNSNNGASILSYTTDSRNSESKNRLWYFVAGNEIPAPDAIESVEEPEDYALAYNPQLHTLHFGAERPESLVFYASVYSTNGQCVKTFRADEQCDVSDLPTGVYIVRWNVSGKTRSAKLAL